MASRATTPPVAGGLSCAESGFPLAASTSARTAALRRFACHNNAAESFGARILRIAKRLGVTGRVH